MSEPIPVDEVKRREEAGELERAIWPDIAAAPRRVLRCRHCGKRNRLNVGSAIMGLDRHRCGACKGPLFLGPHEPLVGLSSQAYQHGLDRRSLAALRSIPGVPALMRKMLEKVGDRSAQLLFMSEAIRCNSEQFPELVDLTQRARKRLDMLLEPAVFLGESPHMNAMTTGVKNPVIVVRSALLDQMNDEELVAILGHELGHLHADHPLYQSVAMTLFRTGASTSQLVRFLGMPLHRALLSWTRSAELTADRAALLASTDLRACISMMLTFAGGNRPGTNRRTRIRLGPFVRQCRELAMLQTHDSVDGVLGGYMALDRTHPHTAWRVIRLIQWVEYGNCLDILSGNYARRRGTGVPRSLPPPAGSHVSP